ncbi:MAG: hypothetical protein KKA10_02205 [Euryarchaeota archaeon]|nr:hypothetical protein [Euryarchaeota archaeon]MCG2737098.1 hypothetical protein [Candidatus Methanoperedenaceae archaeon]
MVKGSFSKLRYTPTLDNIVLWLSRLFGVLNIPIASIAVIHLSSAVFIRAVPITLEQWTGFLIAITVLAGAVAGLTIRSSHSLNRKIAHLLIAAFGLILTFGSLVRLIRTLLFAGWLS